MAAARARAAARSRRRALLRSVPLGDGRAPHAAPGRTHCSSAPAPIASSRAASGRACSTRSSAAPRRACTRWTASCTASRCARSRCSSTGATTSSARELEERMQGGERSARVRARGDLSRSARARSSSCARSSASSSVTDRDQDVLGMYREGDLVELVLLVVRSGRVVDTATFSNRRVEVPDDEVVAAFCASTTARAGAGEAHIPDEVIVPVLAGGRRGRRRVAQRTARGARPRGHAAPRRRRARRRLSAARGASCSIWRSRTRGTRSRRSAAPRRTSTSGSRASRSGCACPRLPRRIECCDISHLGGEDTVGAVVALATASPTRSATAPTT